MSMTPRHITLSLIVLLSVGTTAVIVNDLIAGNFAPILYVDAAALVFFGVLFWATWRGWAYAPYVLTIVITALLGVAIPDIYVSEVFSPAILIPPIIALVLTNTRWIVGCGVAVKLMLLTRAGWDGVYADPFMLIVYAMIIGGLVLGRMVATSATEAAERARSEAERAAAALELANTSLEQRVAERTAEVRTALAEVEARAAEQRRLFEENLLQREMLREMSVPVLPIGDRMLVMPLVGTLDSSRLQLMQAQALESIEREHARYLLLDVTGVPVIDSQIGQGLIGVVQAARLLGAQVSLVGIRPEVAQTIVGLGLQLEGICTFASLRDGVRKLHN